MIRIHSHNIQYITEHQMFKFRDQKHMYMCVHQQMWDLRDNAALVQKDKRQILKKQDLQIERVN